MRRESEWLLENLVQEIEEEKRRGEDVTKTTEFADAKAFVERMRAGDNTGPKVSRR